MAGVKKSGRPITETPKAGLNIEISTEGIDFAVDFAAIALRHSIISSRVRYHPDDDSEGTFEPDMDYVNSWKLRSRIVVKVLNETLPRQDGGSWQDVVDLRIAELDDQRANIDPNSILEDIDM